MGSLSYYALNLCNYFWDQISLLYSYQFKKWKGTSILFTDSFAHTLGIRRKKKKIDFVNLVSQRSIDSKEINYESRILNLLPSLSRYDLRLVVEAIAPLIALAQLKLQRFFLVILLIVRNGCWFFLDASIMMSETISQT